MCPLTNICTTHICPCFLSHHLSTTFPPPFHPRFCLFSIPPFFHQTPFRLHPMDCPRLSGLCRPAHLGPLRHWMDSVVRCWLGSGQRQPASDPGRIGFEGEIDTLLPTHHAPPCMLSIMRAPIMPIMHVRTHSPTHPLTHSPTHSVLHTVLILFSLCTHSVLHTALHTVLILYSICTPYCTRSPTACYWNGWLSAPASSTTLALSRIAPRLLGASCCASPCCLASYSWVWR
jgi:hypothetical protein